jgi:hypothetical protein
MQIVKAEYLRRRYQQVFPPVVEASHGYLEESVRTVLSDVLTAQASFHLPGREPLLAISTK